MAILRQYFTAVKMEDKINILEELVVDQVNFLFNAESQLLTALPDIANKAASDDLKMTLNGFTGDAELKIERLTKILELFNYSPHKSTSLAVDGMIRELSELTEKCTKPAIIDAATILSLRKIFHYKTAIYGALYTYADGFGNSLAKDLLEKSLAEEKSTDQQLTEMPLNGGLKNKAFAQ